MNEAEAIEVLVRVRKSAGHYWRRIVHECWHNGWYQMNHLGAFEGSLQRIRNTFGPSWLMRAKLPPLGLRFETHVGNIGCVNRTASRRSALSCYRTYVKMSEFGYGRAAGEQVTLFADGEPEKSYTPKGVSE